MSRWWIVAGVLLALAIVNVALELVVIFRPFG